MPVARPRSSTRPRSPEPAGAPRSSSCRSRSATGFKVGATVLPAAARPCPAPGPQTAPRPHPQRVVSPARHLCAPGARLCRREAGAGAGPGARGRADPRLPGRLFVSSRREGVRLAQSPAGEEAGGDQQGKRMPPLSLVQPRRWGSSRGAPKAPNAPRAPPPSRGCACCQINPLPLHPPGSPQCPPSAPALVPRTPGRSPSTRSTQLCSGHLGLQVVTLRLAD